MKLLNTYEERDEAEAAAGRITGAKRLASERDATVVIYNLFGAPTWANFYRLGMYNLEELRGLLDNRQRWRQEEKTRHAEIMEALRVVAKNFQIEIPEHWA